jgi:TonB family protein
MRAAIALCALLALPLAARAQQPQQETPQQPAPPAPDATQSPAPGTTTPTPGQQPANAPGAAAPTPAQSSPAPAESSPAQSPTPAPDAAQTQGTGTATPAPGQQPAAAAEPAVPPAQAATPDVQTAPTASPTQPAGISEGELKQMLVGKQVYLRGGYLGDSLNFDEHGHIVGHSPQGSYTLSVVQVDHVRLTKHKVELEGARFGLHFNEQLAYEDSSTSYDKVRITPQKKVVRITIDREIVVNPKKKKESSKEKGKAGTTASQHPSGTAAVTPQAGAAPTSGAQASTPGPAAATASPDQAAQAPATPAPQENSAATAASAPSSASEPGEMSEADQLKASIAATPEAERPADPSSVTTTTSPAHANRLLRDALDAIFAPGLDQRMMAAMPDFWKLYYQAVAAKADYRPADAQILRQNTVDEKAHLLTSFEPESNEFAQNAGVAGMALYHTVIDAEGKPGEIAVARPIGFGLDENAVAAIRKAKFSPAMKDGKPVPVMLDLVVQFRIFSNRTAVQGNPETAEKDKPAGPMLPGPYSVAHH